ncbi:hypothetical protein LOTGIDRAFT_160876 [Lottia gigantea]|uniref:UBA domain-containing protein n=1 Tax=Lottia gigantea TaxID=225164 RepID=V4C0Y2_LOTGI|nr:hypothetical protein LOTGIDRAFT_160876 [Lottia gigantea]ESO95114.1 hypothetical protein LOTGIDRAFT_160876 [Lottia gigantea]
MVFESLVVDLINRFLGDYVENLDSSQLKLGIWGGDAVLQNLDVKESALSQIRSISFPSVFECPVEEFAATPDGILHPTQLQFAQESLYDVRDVSEYTELKLVNDLDLPVKIKAGHIGKLTLKIPWKNLYTAPVVAEIDGIYALAVPNASIRYNEEKEQKAKQDAKQKKLKQIEEAKKLEADKDKAKDPKQDSFAEKLATQVIKNIQIKVSNIHVRYEDNLTNPNHPFAIGATLKDLLFQTTDENWTPTVIKDAVTQIYKLLRLDMLSVYWNSSDRMFQDLPKEAILPALKSSLNPAENKIPLQYILKPISSVAHLKLNTKPELSNFSIPKIFLTLVFDNVAIALNKLQYNDVLETLESLERMALLGIYRKYKPDVPFKGHVKKWWHYAYESILEETVRRRRKMWSWKNIIKHRKLMKSYREAYVRKLDTKKVSSSDQKILDEGEKLLDVFSITIMRQQAEVEAAKLGAKRKEEKGGGWFGGWFGGGKKGKSEVETAADEIKDKFYEMYTPEEKAKLYGAIGYSENEADPTFPKEFVAVQLVTKLNNLSVSLNDTTKEKPLIMRLSLKDVFTSVGQRPAANAVKLEAKIDNMTVTGTMQNNIRPKLVLSQTQDKDQNYSLLTVNFETNPLDGGCDTRIRVNSRPLEIAYDAITINQLADFFKPPESVYLKQLSTAAMAKFDEIKEQSTAGLQHAIDQRKYTEINVNLMSSYVMIPHGGFMKSGVKCLLLDLGNLKVSTQKNQSVDLKKADNIENLMKKAYDKFNITLERIQLLYIEPDDNWQKARDAGISPLHLLDPMSIIIELHKCMFDKDPNMPKMKIFGELPNLSLNISDYRLQQLIALVDSIPFPESPPQPAIEDDLFQGPNTLPMVTLEPSTTVINKVTEQSDNKVKKLQKGTSQEYTNYTDLELKFEIKEIEVKVHEKLENKDIPLLKLIVKSVGTVVSMRSFDMVVDAYLGDISVQHLKFQALKSGPVINLVNTNVDGKQSTHLLKVQYLKADKKGPEFTSTYKSTEQAISVNFMALEVLLHQAAILNLMEFAQKLQPPPSDNKKPALAIEDSKKEEKNKEKKKVDENKPKRQKKKVNPDLIDIQVNAKLDLFSVAICTNDKVLTDVKIKGIDASVTIQKAKTSVGAVLQDITIFDPMPKTLYPKIMSIEGGEVLKLEVVIYNDGTEGKHYGDMSCVDTQLDVNIGCIKLVFLNRYVADLLRFLDNFQIAKERVQEAGEVMAEYSKEVAASLQERAPRVGMNINMKAPLIIVPQKSTSNNLLMMDLGNLAINNKFHLAGQVSTNGVPAVLDKMKIVLKELKLSRAQVLNNGQIKAECLILDPVSITIDICRNLSVAWYHGHPEVDISGILETIDVKLSQGDFAMIMKLVDENLGEGTDISEQQALPAPSKPTPKTNEIQPQTSTLVSAEPKKEESQKPGDKAYCKMKFDFQLKNLSTTFYNGDSDMSHGIVKRKSDDLLGKFALQGMALNGSMMSDTSMVTKIKLTDTILDDLRIAKKKGLTRMITRSTRGGNDKKPCINMIDVDFTQNSTQDKNITVDVCSLKICVCVEFLMTLGDFFMKGMVKPPPPSRDLPPPDVKEKQLVKKQEAIDAPVEGEMNIVFTMERPEIILIEDQLNPDTTSLILDTEIFFKMRQTPDVQTMQAAIKGLHIKSCSYSKRELPGIKILPPCDINLVSSAPHGKDHHMDVNITDIILNISPATIRTMAAVASGFSVQPSENEKSNQEVIPADLWATKKVTEDSHWFTKLPQKPEESEDDRSGTPLKGEGDRCEQMIISLSSLVIKLEGGVGKRTVPLLIVESSFQGEVKNWSSQLYVDTSLSLEVAYYNELLAVWEPLLEPVVKDSKVHRWDLNLNVVAADDSIIPVDQEETDVDNIVLPPPKMTINVKSVDNLNITMTKTCLEVLGKLGKSFNDAYNLVKPGAQKDEITSPYVFKNQTGLDLLLKLDTTFQSPDNSLSGRVKLASGETLPTYEKPGSVMSMSPKASVIKATQQGVEKKIIFQVEQFGATRELVIKRAEKRLFQINQRSHSGDMWSIVCCTDTNVGQKIVSLRSIVQICNNLTMPVEILYKGDTKLETCGVAYEGEIFSVPLAAVYSLHGELYFKPLDGEYMDSENGYKWKNAGDMKQICCKNAPGQPSFYFNVNPTVEDIYFEASNDKSSKCYMLNLHPTVILHNLLPMSVKYQLEGSADETTLEDGVNVPLHHASVNDSTLALTLPNYRGRDWTGNRVLKLDVPELSVWTIEAYEGSTRITMDLGLHCKINNGSFDVTIFSPYWMINKTGMTLYYQGSDSDESIEHPPIFDGCILFAYKPKSLFSKKKKTEKSDDKKTKVKEMKQSGKAQMKIGNDTEWSDKFSLDTVGSSGSVQCKNKSTGRLYEVGVNISITSSGLSKIVTFSPFYLLLNTADYVIQCAEVQEKSTQDVTWSDIPPQGSIPFWPEQDVKEVKLKARVSNTVINTTPFLVNKAHTTLMKLENEFGGIQVECNVSESAMVTKFKSYKSGFATVNIVNFTSKGVVHYNQSGHSLIHTLNSEESCLYTWEDALGKLELIWSCGKEKDMKNELTQDGIGEFFLDSDTKIYWVSFLDGMQRVLLFTEDLVLATLAQQAGELERIDQEINLSIVGMGFSLVNNYTQTEVAFMGITSSGIIWEEKKKRYKGLNLKTTTILETAWQKYISELAVGHSPPSRLQLENKIEVDFSNKDKLMMLKPNKREIKRSFIDGIWLQYKVSSHQVQFHAKLNRLQFDNQLNQAIFPTVLSPLPPPKSVAAESVPKPFIEVSMMQRKHEYTTVSQIKYAKVLIQEMAVHVDQGFLNAVLELFAADTPVSREQEFYIFCLVCFLSVNHSFEDPRAFLRKIHLSFSLQSGSSGDDGKPTEIKSDVVNVFLQSVGVVLTDVQDVVFKLGYFERNHKFYNQSQLTNEMTRHYAGQAIKQMYVLVLGLDVLGNPFGLLRGLSEGVGDLFYEPYQGLIQGPEEFAEGMVLGVRSLFGHAIGGAAGAVSRITGTVGKGLAALTLDDDYQKKRRQQLNKKPASAKEGFARGGKGLVMGFVDGAAGIVKKPLEGAQKEGVGGFFKGVGKGLVGVVTRPTSGVIDFASSSLEGIKRITDMSDEVRRLRPPRRFHNDQIIRPYNHQEAEGYAILQETEKGRFASSDEYSAHVVVSKDKKIVFLVTDLRLLLVKKGELFGVWDCEWSFEWKELNGTPKKTSKGLEIILKEKEKKSFFGSSSSKKEIPVSDHKVLDWIVVHIEEAMARAK